MPAPPNPIRAGGPDLRYQMGLGDTVIEQSLASRRGKASRRECWCDGVSRAGRGGRGEDERAVVGSGSPRPSTEGALPSRRPARHWVGPSSVAVSVQK